MRRIRTLLLEVGLILLAIVLGKIFDSPIGYCVAWVLAIGFISAWFIGRGDDDESDSANKRLFAGDTSGSSPSVGMPKLMPVPVPAEGRYQGKFDFLLRNDGDDAAVNVTVHDIRLPVPESAKRLHGIGEALIGREAEDGQPEWVVQFFCAGVHAHVALVSPKESKPLAYRVNGIGPLHGQNLAYAFAACGQDSDVSCEMFIDFSNLGMPIRRWRSRYQLTYDHVYKSIAARYIETLSLDDEQLLGC